MVKVAAGIITYEPDIGRLDKNIQAILSQVHKILIIDNASKNFEQIKSIAIQYENVMLIHNEKNAGVAKALNQVIEHLGNLDFDWILTLDQDTVCSNNIVDRLTSHINFNKIAVVCPKVIDVNYSGENIHAKTGIEYISRAITSGSMINSRICQELGGFDEKMFIDLVDFDYSYRLTRAGHKILRDNDAFILHQLGDLEVHKLFGKNIYVTNHSPSRVYYYIRNNIYFYRKHKDAEILCEITQNIFKRLFKILFYENEKIKKIKCFVKGFFHGVKIPVVD